MLLGFIYLFIYRIQDLEGIHLDDRMNVRHLAFRKTFPDHLVNEKDLCLRMVYKMVDVCRLELMKKRNRNGTVGHCGQKGYSPVCLVS